MSFPVNTAHTPGMARAASTSIALIRACAQELRTNDTCRVPGGSRSSTKRPVPVTKRSVSFLLTRSPMGGWIGKSIVMLSFVFFVLRRLRKFFDRPPPTKNRNLLAPSRQVRNPFFLTFAPLRLCARYCDSFGCRFAALPLCLRGEGWFTPCLLVSDEPSPLCVGLFQKLLADLSGGGKFVEPMIRSTSVDNRDRSRVICHFLFMLGQS